jgi:glycogen debranching enzyme
MALEITVGPPRLAINQGYGVLITDPDGQIPWPTDKGFYHSDTRVISSWQIFADGEAWDLLNSGNIAYDATRIFLTNRTLHTEIGDVPEHTLGLSISRAISGGIHEDLDLVNHGMVKVQFNLEIAVRCDFADIFEVKSGHIVRRGRITTQWSQGDARLTTTYLNKSFERRLTATARKCDSRPVYANGRISFELELDPGEAWHGCVLYAVGDGESVENAPDHCIAFAQTANARTHHKVNQWRDAALKIETPNEEFYQFYHQSLEDMAALRLPIDGTDHLEFVPAAGIPWFLALFGRDSLTVSLQNAMVYPSFARGALEVLSRYQARKRDDYRDAEPGKIMHELRRGELAHFKLIPHTPYYGTADATILYLIVLHNAWRWTGDADLLTRFMPAAEKCLAWIDKYGDRDGDGFQEYQTRSSAGAYNQGWKDSGQALVNADGSIVKTPISGRDTGLRVRRVAAHGPNLRRPGQTRPRRRPATQGQGPLQALQRRLLGRGFRLLRLRFGRRQETGPERRLEPGPVPVVGHRSARPRRQGGEAAHGAGHVERLGHPHPFDQEPLVQSQFLPERRGVAAR